MKNIFYVFLLVIAGCTGKKFPSEIIEPQQMKLVVWDILRADEYVLNQLNADTSKTTKQKLAENYGKVFSLHNLSSETFYKSYKYYQAHPLLHKELMDSVYAYGTREKAKQDSATVPGKLMKPTIN